MVPLSYLEDHERSSLASYVIKMFEIKSIYWIHFIVLACLRPAVVT
jgi:hypothetical protein